jgi:C4-dicarboxylate transporter, DctM subunit
MAADERPPGSDSDEASAASSEPSQATPGDAVEQPAQEAAAKEEAAVEQPTPDAKEAPHAPAKDGPAKEGPAMERSAAKPVARTVLQRINDVVFTLEQGMVAFFLLAIAFMVFIDVVQRRLVAPDSKLADLFDGPLFFLPRETVETIAPFIGAALGLGILVFAYRAAERQRGKPILSIPGSAWILGIATAVGFAAMGYMIITIPSWIVYLVLWFAGLAGFTYGQLKDKREGYTLRLGVAWAVVTPLVVYIATSWFPEGYSWAKEIALIMTLWVGLFGASICVHEGKHIRLEALEKSHPEQAKVALAVLGRLVAAVFSGFMAFLGYRYLFSSEGGMFYVPMRLEQTRIPIWFEMLAVPVAFGLTAIRLAASAVSAAMGGSYGDPAKAEGMEDAERLAAEAAKAKAAEEKAEEKKAAPAPAKRPTTFLIVTGIIVVSAFFGPAGIMVAAILAGALLAQPLFVVLGAVVLLCFALWGDAGEPYLVQVSPLVERIAGLADNPALLAIPLFISSGAIMAHGDISKKLVRFAQSLLGWLPGGLAISAVFACMVFAAISGSSPATVIAIGGIMAPALIKDRYRPEFAHGLVTSSGSLGILIPPSIPMIVYQIVNTSAPMRVEELFAAGYGPGLVIGGVLMGYSMYRGVVDKTPRQAFVFREIIDAGADGFWALMFPIIIMGGITTGIFNAVESAAVSVIYAIAVEVWVHRAIKISDLPKIMHEVGVLLGSFLVILVVAICFGEFLEVEGIPRMASDWIASMNLEPWQFLLVVNLLLLVVGCLMDIMSAIFIFVPLLGPMAMAMGIDPLHFAIIFIVNLEIGYLTPPVGLNLFVSSTLFNKPVEYMIRAVLPFIALMGIGLMIITYYPPISGDFGRWILGVPAYVAPPPMEETGDGEVGDDEVDDDDDDVPARPSCEPPEDLNCDGTVTMEEMTAFAGSEEEDEAPPPHACEPPEDLNCDGTVTMEEMTEFAGDME